MIKIIASIILVSGLTFPCYGQENQLITITQGRATNLRGLSVYQSKTIWASGSGGQVGRSLDGGRTWKWLQPKGYESRDFRDIHAFNAQSAIITLIDTPAILLKTTNGGQSWEKVYESKQPGMFLDAIDFANAQNGILVGDPVNGKLFLARTTDGGKSWHESHPPIENKIAPGEAFFAASGTNIHLGQNGQFILVSGGAKSRLLSPDCAVRIPAMMQGGETTGANGLAVLDSLIVIVGGDFTHPERKDSCLAISTDKGRTWQKSDRSPGGYMSAAAIIDAQTIFIAGLNGVWYTQDQGKSWKNISRNPFNAAFYDKKSKTIYFAGPDGHISAFYL